MLVNPCLKPDFLYIVKQRGGLFAKGRLLGIQFAELFRDGLYYELARHANGEAMRIKAALTELGVAFQVDSPTNQQFIYLSAGRAGWRCGCAPAGPPSRRRWMSSLPRCGR